jgi:hypothetical protein
LLEKKKEEVESKEKKKKGEFKLNNRLGHMTTKAFLI